MRRILWAAALVAAACDGTDDVEGTRGPCASGGQLLGDPACFGVASAEDACWKLVDCGVILLLDVDGNLWDWDRCVDHLEGLPDAVARVAIACVGAASCDQLATRGFGERPDCLEYR
jgi:hypothetical protein